MRYSHGRRLQDRWAGEQNPPLPCAGLFCARLLLWQFSVASAIHFFRAEAYNRSPKFNLSNRTSWDGELFVNLAKQGARIGFIQADLACFRIHGDSISDSGRMNGQYRQDSRRVFRELEGRTWGANDEVLRLIHRAGGLVRRLGYKVQPGTGKGAA